MTTADIETLQVGFADPESTAVVFQALGCLQGIYTPFSSNCLRGTLTTLDGVQFPATIHYRIKQYLKGKFEVLEPGQPFRPNGEICRWKIYPNFEVDGALHLQIMLLVAESYRLPPDCFTITGLLTQQDEQEQSVSIRVYRNTPGDKYHPNLSPQFFPLQLVGYLPNLRVGQIVRVSAQREGTKLVVTEARAVSMSLDERVRKDIEQFLTPQKPLPPPVKRSLAKVTQPKVVQAETVVGQSAGVPVQSAVFPQQLLEGSKLVSTLGTSDEVPSAHKTSPKHKQGVFPGIVLVEPESIAPAQPELSTIVTNLSTDPTAIPDASAIPADKSKKKKQATAPTPAAEVPAEKKPEAAQRPKPKFLVQVDRQTFAGQSSVVLKTGMLFIDGKQVVRTKLAIVVGDPQEVSADGKTQKTGNRTILSSR